MRVQVLVALSLPPHQVQRFKDMDAHLPLSVDAGSATTPTGAVMPTVKSEVLVTMSVGSMVITTLEDGTVLVDGQAVEPAYARRSHAV